jgi:hypothetical protein
VGDLVISAGQNAQVVPAAAGATLAFAGTVAVGGGGSLAVANLALPLQALITTQIGLSGPGSRLSFEAVTVPERPEWGALTGAMAANADGEAWTTTGNIPSFFIVLSGPCTLAEGGRCVGRWPGGYLPNERCDILVGGAVGGVLGPCPVFNTNSIGYDDPLTLPGGAKYSGASCPAGVPLAAGDAISWLSNGSWQGEGGFYGDSGGDGLPFSDEGAGGGWQICFA